jgi:hypothetical protein
VRNSGAGPPFGTSPLPHTLLQGWLKRGFDIRPNRLAVQTWLTQSGVNTHRGFAMLTVVFLAAIFACFQLLGMWLRLKAMEQKFDYLMELLLAPTTEEQPPRQN